MKGQITTEFLFAFGMLFVLFIGGMVFVAEKKSDLRITKQVLDKRDECLRFSNLVSAVATSGSGTVLNTETDYLIKIYNESVIGVTELENSSTVETRIAVVVSEAGETTQTFYDSVNTVLTPAWYKNCYSDIDSAGCQSTGADVNYSLIPLDLSDLICTDLNNYNVMYVEDSHIQSTAQCSGNVTYLQKLENWVAQGNILIGAEHLMCREQSSGTYALTSYRCNPPGSNGDAWSMFGKTVYQRGGAYGNPVTVLVTPDPAFFPTLTQGQTYDFEESSYVFDPNVTVVQGESMTFTTGYESSVSCQCSSPSGGSCARHSGSTNTPANASWISTVTGTYEVRIKYCGESDGTDNWAVYKNNTFLTNWSSVNNEPDWNEKIIGGVSLTAGEPLKINCDKGTANSYCRLDLIKVRPSYGAVVVASYDEDTEPAIAYWEYGAGKVFYFGDFQVGGGQQTVYSDMIAELIEKASATFFTAGSEEVLCTHVAPMRWGGEYSSRIKIENANGRIMMTNL
ncbi:MAG: hypothetical protein WC595_00265 [Candidatus Nanoarchaeia archaeon]